MESFCKTEGMWFELLTRILCDIKPPREADLIYLYGQTQANENSVLERGVRVLNQNLVTEDKIGICGIKEGYGYPGADAWFSKLCNLGADPKKIIKIKLIEYNFPPCTASEADGLIARAISEKWHTIIITASPLHQVRAFISTISAMRRAKTFLWIYNCVGEPVDWLQYIVHSQGTTRGIRKDLLQLSELRRINKYHGKGSLIAVEKILIYLNQRDAE